MIDLVRDDGDTLAVTPGADPGQRGIGHGRAGRIGGAREQQRPPQSRAARKPRKRRSGRHPALLIPDRERDRLDPEGAGDVAIAGIAGLGHQQLIALIQQRQERQHEPGRRAGRDDHLGRRYVDVVGIAVMPGDPLAQRRDAERVGIAEQLPVDGGLHRLPHHARRRCSGLSDFHVNNIVAFCDAFICRAHHVHDHERRDLAAAGRGGGRRARRFDGLLQNQSPKCHAVAKMAELDSEGKRKGSQACGPVVTSVDRTFAPL